jgi:flavin reductase (DIM6/NTAB) family NADH-FMN oxidoreductase RutF
VLRVTKRPAINRVVTDYSENPTMRSLLLSKAFTLIESGPVVLVSTNDGKKNNIMTISWTMVLDFTPRFAITTGEWNYSFRALKRTRECVIAIPTVDLLDKVVGIGTCSGKDTDKFVQFELTPMPGRVVKAPLIKECLANIECRVVDIVRKHNIVVLEAVAAHVASSRREKRTVHAVGDGTFIVDGWRLNRRKQMASKVPPGL